MLMTSAISMSSRLRQLHCGLATFSERLKLEQLYLQKVCTPIFNEKRLDT